MKRIRNAKNAYGSIEILDNGQIQLTDKEARGRKLVVNFSNLTDNETGSVANTVDMGLKAPVGNIVINGGFSIWQRDASSDYSLNVNKIARADMWFTQATGIKITQVEVAPMTDQPNITHALQCDQHMNTTAKITTRIPAHRSRVLTDIPSILSLWIKHENIPYYNEFVVKILVPTTPNGFMESFTQYQFNCNSSTGYWGVFRFPLHVSANLANGIEITIEHECSPTIATSFQLTGVMLQPGSYSTLFTRATSNDLEELRLCQEYYENMGLLSTYSNATFEGTPGEYWLVATHKYSVPKRSYTPTITIKSFDKTLNHSSVNTPFFSMSGDPVLGDSSSESLSYSMKDYAIIHTMHNQPFRSACYYLESEVSL